MKKFIKKVIYIILPVLLIGVLVELFISYYPNTFNTKAQYLNSNLDTIECLFLGSSHTQNAINPKYIDKSSINLAYGSQDYQLDSALFFNYVTQLKQLKTVVLEMDYHSLEKKNSHDYFRLAWYYRYYDINMANFEFMNKLSLFYSNKAFFKNYLINKINPKNEPLDINEFGFVENDSDIFEKLEFNKEEILKSSKARLEGHDSALKLDYFDFNKSKILSVIDYAHSNGINVIILNNPVYHTYSDNYDDDRNKRRMTLLDSLKSAGTVKVLDFEYDDRFDVEDFKNDDHLNPAGAKKLTELVNTSL